MKKVYFTSDLHFGHANVLYFHPERRQEMGINLDMLQANKNLAVQQMNDWIINKWNNTVDKDDYVYILGDLCLSNKASTERILSKLKGKKYLIRGNHDKSCKGLERYFEWVGDIREVKFTHNQFDFIDINEPFCVELCHFPLLGWNRRMHGTIMVHGHTHGCIDKVNTESKELRIDIGFDSAMGFHKLVSLKELYDKMKLISKIDGKQVSFKEYINYKALQDGIRY